jgi:hydrogenase maturation protease
MKAPVAIFGIGNRSRGDDAAGPLLVEGLSRWLEEEGLGTQFECFEEYQLQPENALDLVGRRLALFVDARVGLAEPVRLECLVPAAGTFAAGTHELSPGETLAVYRAVTGEDPPPAFALGVRADSFELGDAPGESTRAAMREAKRLLAGLCLAPEAARWREAASAPTPSPSPCAPSPS